MRNILVAVDGSEPALRAAQVAVAIAARFGGCVTLAHCGDFDSADLLPGDELATAFVAVARAKDAEGRSILAETEMALPSSGLTILTRLVSGSPAQSIAELVNGEPFDLVATGSRGRNAAARILLGSFADRLLHLSKKPVLVVR